MRCITGFTWLAGTVNSLRIGLLSHDKPIHMKLFAGSDHAGYTMKQMLVEHLKEQGHIVDDLGTHSSDSTDYPDYAHIVAQRVLDTEGSLGILLCGSANGVCMSANKHAGIRAALCWTEEIAVLARSHNNANIICIPARYVTDAVAKAMTEKFLSTPFEGGRHQRRVEKIDNEN